LPIVRELLISLGCRSIARESFEMVLKDHHNVLMVPGGMAEMRFSLVNNQDITVVTRHKGFIRLAMKYGVDLVPVFSFGETKLLDPACPLLQRYCWKTLRIPFPVFFGRWFMQIPNQTPIAVAVGAPIVVEQNNHPTDSEVDAIHRIYFTQLRLLFEANKEQCGHGNSNLIMEGFEE